MITLFAGIGLGSIIAALIGWSVAISNHRQAWINALRDDLATFLKKLEAVHYAIGDLLAAKTADDLASREPKTRDARIAILFVYGRIILRPNRKEPLHVELGSALNALMKVETRTPEAASVDAMVDLARRVLKREWEVAKLGPLAKPVMWWRE